MTDERRQVLFQLISDFSEGYFCARWLHDIEVILWSEIVGASSYYQHPTTRAKLDELRKLSQELGGWAVWDEGEPKFISLEEWTPLYEQRRRQRLESEQAIKRLEQILDRIDGFRHMAPYN